jgi:hypothetical protein
MNQRVSSAHTRHSSQDGLLEISPPGYKRIEIKRFGQTTIALKAERLVLRLFSRLETVGRDVWSVDKGVTDPKELIPFSSVRAIVF